MFTECPVIPQLICTQLLCWGRLNRMWMIKLSLRMLHRTLAQQAWSWSSIYYSTAVQSQCDYQLSTGYYSIKSSVLGGMVAETHTIYCDCNVKIRLGNFVACWSPSVFSHFPSLSLHLWIKKIGPKIDTIKNVHIALFRGYKCTTKCVFWTTILCNSTPLIKIIVTEKSV